MLNKEHAEEQIIYALKQYEAEEKPSRHLSEAACS